MLVTLRDYCICTQLHIWTALHPTDIGQLLSHPRANHPLLICTLQHTTSGCDVGPTCNTQQLAIFLYATALLLVQLAPYQVNGWQKAPPTSTLLARHKTKAAWHNHYTPDSAGALSPNPPARTTVVCFNYCTAAF